jgi:hypothetical protein
VTITDSELAILHSYLDGAEHYVEFGSGASTIYAASVASLKSIDCVESSPEFFDQSVRSDPGVAEAIRLGRLRVHTVDIGRTEAWGLPADRSKMELWPVYPNGVFAQKNRVHDLVLVDGRFRVACAVAAALNTPDHCIILMHDFPRREDYPFWKPPYLHEVLTFLDLIEHRDSLAVLQKRTHLNVRKAQSAIKKFQYLPGDRSRLFELGASVVGAFQRST